MIFLLDFDKCPICGKRQKVFRGIGENSPPIKKYKIIGAGLRNAGCVKCGSSDRDRLVYFYLKDYLQIFNRKNPLKLLHIAPERTISAAIMENKFIEYIMGDKFEKGYDYNDKVIRLDICDIPFENNYFDVTICNHVLEHVENDRKAMIEIFRVLKKGGLAILQVPISNTIKRTYEDFSITNPDERKDVFGQCDHVRIYGQDYPDRIKKAGFKVKRINISKNKEYRRNGLNADEDIFIGVKS